MSITRSERRVVVVSFGFGHLPDGEPPAADMTYDVRIHFKDPHVRPELRDLTGADQAVKDAVMATTGIPELVDGITASAMAYRAGPVQASVVIAVGCVGGRHRSVVIADQVAAQLRSKHVPVTVKHYDIERPVISRPVIHQ